LARLSPAQKRALLDELIRRRKQGQATRDLHEGQRRFIFAKDAKGELARFIHLLSPRRFGKTEGFLRYACDRAQQIPRYRACAVYQRLTDAREIAWQHLVDLNDHYEWGAEFNKNELRVTFPGTRGYVKLFGLDEERRHGQVRGPKWYDVLIDEAQGFYTDLDKLIQGLLPTLADYRGRIFLVGTPGDYDPERRYFGRIHIGAKNTAHWVRCTGSSFENPHTAQEMRDTLAQVLEGNPGGEMLPWIRREFFAEWVLDDREIVIPISDDNFVRRWTPHSDDRYVLAVKWGAQRNGLLVGTYNTKHTAHAVYLEARVIDATTPDETIAAIVDYRDRYPGLQVLTDPGGISKEVRDELERVHSLPIIKAPRLDREGAIKLMRGDVAAGRVVFFHRAGATKTHSGAEVCETPELHPLAQQWRRLVYTQIGKRREEGTPRELHDCALHMRPYMHAHLWCEQPVKPKHGTPEYWAEQEQDPRPCRLHPS